jgi:hypothetical protein
MVRPFEPARKRLLSVFVPSCILAAHQVVDFKSPAAQHVVQVAHHVSLLGQKREVSGPR